ncbi:hypothetical protein FRC00_014586, partial [Tulasnella sp. 408]
SFQYIYNESFANQFEGHKAEESKATSDTSLEIDPLGPYQVGPYIKKGDQKQPIKPFIPDDWHDHITYWVDDNPYIRRQGDLELDLYRNYHGDTFWWNDWELRPDSVILNNLEGYILIYTQQDLTNLLYNTSDKFQCVKCNLPQGHFNPVRFYKEEFTPPIQQAPVLPRPELKRTQSIPIYTVDRLLEIGKPILEQQKKKGKRPAYNKPPFKKAVSLEGFIVRAAPKEVEYIQEQILLIEKFWKVDKQRAINYIHHPDLAPDLGQIIYYFEESSPIVPHLRAALSNHLNSTQEQVTPNWSVCDEDWKPIKQEVDSDGDISIKEEGDHWNQELDEGKTTFQIIQPR